MSFHMTQQLDEIQDQSLLLAALTAMGVAASSPLRSTRIRRSGAERK